MLKIYPFIIETLTLLAPIVRQIAKHDPDLAKQLRKCGSSIALNTAEGVGVSGGNERVRFRTALGSNQEVRACLDVDTMGMKHRVDQGVYVCYGSMNPQLAEKTGFSDADAEVIKKILPKLLENDESSARPAGSMEVLKVVWWKHHCKSGQHSSAKVHRTLKVQKDGGIEIDRLNGLQPEILEGF